MMLSTPPDPGSSLYNPYLLYQHENSADAWEANAAGMLTPSQMKRIKGIPPDVAEEISAAITEENRKRREFFKRRIEKPLYISNLVLLPATCVLALFAFIFSDLRAISLIVLLVTIIAFTSALFGSGLSQEATPQQVSNALKSPLLTKLRKLRIANVDGDKAFRIHSDLRSVTGLLSMDSYFGIKIGGMEFAERLDPDYWRMLREDEFAHGQKPYVVYYYDNWCDPPPILSMHALDAVLPPGEAKLKRVVGVGDDGELVYDDEVSEAQETTEIIEIERKDRTNFSDR